MSETHVGAMAQDMKQELEDIAGRCFCLHARMAARAVTRRYNAALAPLNLEVTEFTLLAAVEHGRMGSIAELAERLAFERTTLVRNLKRLAERGLIAKAGGGGRAVNYVLSPQGHRLLKQALPAWETVQAGVERRMANGEPAALRESLAGLRRAVRA